MCSHLRRVEGEVVRRWIDRPGPGPGRLLGVGLRVAARVQLARAVDDEPAEHQEGEDRRSGRAAVIEPASLVSPRLRSGRRRAENCDVARRCRPGRWTAGQVQACRTGRTCRSARTVIVSPGRRTSRRDDVDLERVRQVEAPLPSSARTARSAHAACAWPWVGGEAGRAGGVAGAGVERVVDRGQPGRTRRSARRPGTTNGVVITYSIESEPPVTSHDRSRNRSMLSGHGLAPCAGSKPVRLTAVPVTVDRDDARGRRRRDGVKPVDIGQHAAADAVSRSILDLVLGEHGLVALEVGQGLLRPGPGKPLHVPPARPRSVRRSTTRLG